MKNRNFWIKVSLVAMELIALFFIFRSILGSDASNTSLCIGLGINCVVACLNALLRRREKRNNNENGVNR